MASVERVMGEQGTVLRFPEHATAGSFVVGDLVKLASNGKVQIATADTMIGIAKRDASGTVDTQIEVELLSVDSIYRMRYKASATSQALVGDLADITYTAGAHVLDESGAAQTEVYIVGLDPMDAVGTSGGRLYVRFHNAIFVNNF